MLAAFPVSWLVDRFSPYRLMPFFCLISIGVLVLFLNIRDANGLILAACLQAIIDRSIIRGHHGLSDDRSRERRSVHSTNSCLRGFYNGCIALGIGWLIQASGGNYQWAYIAACTLTVLGLIPLFLYRHLMREAPLLPAAVTTEPLVSKRS